MDEFTTVKKGYDKREVDVFCRRQKIECEQKLAEQKDRIFELVEQVRKLEAQLSEYRGKDGEISGALVKAVSKAKEIESAAKAQYVSEVQRLRLFQGKWQRYYEEILDRYPVENGLLSVNDFLEQLGQMTDIGWDRPETGQDMTLRENQERVERDHREEESRLQRQRETVKTVKAVPVSAGSEPFQPMELLQKYLNSSKKTVPQGKFNMDDVLHPPKDLDLGELCTELGLMERND